MSRAGALFKAPFDSVEMEGQGASAFCEAQILLPTRDLCGGGTELRVGGMFEEFTKLARAGRFLACCRWAVDDERLLLSRAAALFKAPFDVNEVERQAAPACCEALLQLQAFKEAAAAAERVKGAAVVAATTLVRSFLPLPPPTAAIVGKTHSL